MNYGKKYVDYFNVKEGYYPEINPNSIKDKENKWEETYPHETFIDLLDITQKIINREVKKGIWIEGAYGTGKSRVVWALQNLIECDNDKFIEYWNMYDNLKKKEDLRDRFLLAKEKNNVVAFRYGSDEINSTRKLVMAVYSSITAILKKKGYEYFGEKTLKGRVIEWINNNRDIFELLIKKPEYRGYGSFAGKSVDDIVNQLKNGDSNNMVLNDILEMADKQGINTFDFNMDNLCEWIDDVIVENNIDSLILIWDEFTSYFKQNTALDSFQKLAEMSNSSNFYLFIVTHMSGSIMNEKDNSYSAVNDRFIHKEIKLPDNIAFELIAHALQVKEQLKNEWKNYATDLNTRLSESRKQIGDYTGITEKTLSNILPITPTAALLLKNISEKFASNQRSMFNFIKSANNFNVQDFQWFIENHGPDDLELLTIDYLWDFFYENGTDEHSKSRGKSNLDITISMVLDTYPRNQNKLTDNDHKRVLKAILMMQAISQKLNNSVPLLRPNENNLKMVFEGTDLENRAGSIARNILVNQYKILYFKPIDNGKEEYASSSISGDQAQIDKLKERYRDTKTNKLIDRKFMNDDSLKIQNVLSFGGAINSRYIFTIATKDDFVAKIKKISAEDKKAYQIRGVICIAKNETEQSEMRNLIRANRYDEIFNDIVFIDATGSTLTNDMFEEWVNFSANEEYWRPKDAKLADKMKKDADALLSEWANKISNGRFDLVTYQNGFENCPSLTLLKDALLRYVLKKYPLSFDNAKVSDNCFSSSNLRAGAEYGLSKKFGGVFQQNQIINILQGALNTENYWLVEETKNLSISRLKLELDNYIKSEFEKDVRISVTDIFNFLIEKGFTPCNLYAYLTGFLLKEYTREPYRYSIGTDGENGGVMDSTTMSAFIAEVMKNIVTPNKNYKERYIAIMTTEQKAFIDFCSDVFDVQENSSVEHCVNKLRYQIKNLDYPIWVYKKIDIYDCQSALDKLAQINNPRNNQNVNTLASECGRMFIDNKNLQASLKQLLTKENGKKAMKEFLNDFCSGELITFAENIGANILSDVKNQIGTEEHLWLWEQETGEQELKKLLIDYKIIVISNEILNVHNTNLTNTIREWKEFTNATKIPYVTIANKYFVYKNFVYLLRDIAKNSGLPHTRRQEFLNELAVNRQNIEKFINERNDIFNTEFESRLEGLSYPEKESVYSKLPASSFLDDASTFTQNIINLTREIRSQQNKFKLENLWKTLTHTANPSEWSKKYSTPIIIMIPKEERDNAKKVFDIINDKFNINVPSDIELALNYLEEHSDLFSKLDDTEKIDKNFKQYIIDKYQKILNVDEVREELNNTQVFVYDWYNDNRIKEKILKMAEDKYIGGENQKVFAIVEKMDAEKAKEYLIKLIMNNFNVGIEIMGDDEIE